jgi:hypothetical protein
MFVERGKGSAVKALTGILAWCFIFAAVNLCFAGEECDPEVRKEDTFKTLSIKLVCLNAKIESLEAQIQEIQKNPSLQSEISKLKNRIEALETQEVRASVVSPKYPSEAGGNSSVCPEGKLIRKYSKFCFQVDELEVLSNSYEVVLYMTLFNRTDQELILALDPRPLFEGNWSSMNMYPISLTDDKKNKYTLKASTGIQGGDKKHVPLVLAPRGSATSSLVFNIPDRSNIGSLFKFVGQLAVVQVDTRGQPKRDGNGYLQFEPGHSVLIRDIKSGRN